MKSYLSGFLFFNKRSVCQLLFDQFFGQDLSLEYSIQGEFYAPFSTVAVTTDFSFVLWYWVFLLGCDWDLSLWTQIFQVPLHHIRLRQMLDRWNVTNRFKAALYADRLHHSLDTLDLDSDLLLLLFNIKIFLLIWLSNWQLFLHFNLSTFMVMVVVVVRVRVGIVVIQHQHQYQPLYMNMEIFLSTFSKDWVYFPLFLLLLHMVVVFGCHQLLLLYVSIIINSTDCCFTVVIF